MIWALCWSVLLVQAQITIDGNIYGGGNAGDVGGSASVVIRKGDLHQVFGGARQADVGGSTLVNIDGEHLSGDVVVDAVYGGNDIAGTVGSSADVPDALKTETDDEDNTYRKNGIDNTYNAFVRVGPERTVTTTTKDDEDNDVITTTQPHHIFIGQLFGGGNGDYNYSSDTYSGLSAPLLGKAYLEVKGGTIAYTYGGGNNATVTEATDICIDNESEVTLSTHVYKNGNKVLTADRLQRMGIAILGEVIDRDVYHFSRVFGGNNKADMDIQPTWHLEHGHIENLYSGGNEGRMTHTKGLLLEIMGTSEIMVDNVYGGCRKADVRPISVGKDGVGRDAVESEIQLTQTNDDGTPKYMFPAGLSARVLVRGGDINNVYGGNDISGRVYGGNAVGVYHSIRGNVYGGGNGSYPYTDNDELKSHVYYGDYYYRVPAAKTSVEALNEFRPNAEQVSIRLKGTDADHPTIIGGAVYVGGNSATLATTKPSPMVHLKIGSHVIVDNVFLGNNGENMVKTNAANPAEGIGEGVLRTISRTDIAGDGSKFNSMDLTNADVFAQYMEGCAMTLMPGVVFDQTKSDGTGDPDDYEPYSSFFGSIFCGGNVGSMMVPEKTLIDFKDKIVVYNKVVGGCNNAFVPELEGINAEYRGGLLGSKAEQTARADGLYADASGNIKDRLELRLRGLKIQPKRWIDPTDKTLGLEWNTISAATGLDVAPVTSGSGITDDADMDRRLKNGNIYGGCYASGHVNGNVIINVEANIIDRDLVFDEVEGDAYGEGKLYGNDSYNITTRHSGVILDLQGMDVMGRALNVFGGGYGEDTEIWGATTINMKRGYTFQVFGGSEKGVIGKKNDEGDYAYDERFSANINLMGTVEGASKANNSSEDMAEAEFIYGGGFEGLITGDTHVYLGNGRVFNSFAGSVNANILGHTETYIGMAANGAPGFPWVRDHTYGGNDLGGNIEGWADFSDRVREDVAGIKDHIHGGEYSTRASAYTEYRQGRVEYIFGGSYGDYDYADDRYKDNSKPYLHNAFVNFRPRSEKASNEVVARVYGSAQGHTQGTDLDKMQDRSYVLIDIPASNTNFEGMAVFGAGSWCGLGMRAAVPSDNPATFATQTVDADRNYSAVVDLFRGSIGNVYGGSFNEGFTRRAVINVPSISTVKVRNLFGGAFGSDPLVPCDVYEAQVNYHSENAIVQGNIYGGNNNADRTLYGQVNIDVPVYNGAENPQTHERYLSTVFGAGYGLDTWSQYTEVNLLSGARVYEVYGGGHNGRVLNIASLRKWEDIEATDGHDDTTLDLYMYDYPENGLYNLLAKPARIHDVDSSRPAKYNTNVHIYEGAVVSNYAYGGGLGFLKTYKRTNEQFCFTECFQRFRDF